MKFSGLIKPTVGILLIFFSWTGADAVPGLKGKKAMIYCSDLFQPPDDPDDHFDWAIVSALGDLDVRAFVFDMASPARKPADAGITALLQASRISGVAVPPYASGLKETMKSVTDDCLWQSSEHQGGVELILETLRRSKKPVTMFLVGSCRDFAAAFNRDPELMRRKVEAVYVNAGNGLSGEQWEWNVRMEPVAYKALMSSGLPIYWCPCVTGAFAPPSAEEISEGRAFCTFYFADNQRELLSGCRKEARNYFAYALDRSTADPIAFLEGPEQELPTDGRNMWCTAPLLHASGREIYRTQDGEYLACTPAEARRKGIGQNRVDVFGFEPVRLEFEDDSPRGLPVARLGFGEEAPNMKIFRYTNPEFNEIMTEVLKQLLSKW